VVVGGAQPAFHAVEEFLGVDGLGYVVAGACVDVFFSVALHGAGGYGDYREVGEAGHLADGAGCLVAVHEGHHHVHEDQVDIACD
jgi:hypothetical protein